MLYNKNQFKKVNDKKVLHKIKKHWITVSIAMLGLIGGGAVATTNVSANMNNQNNNDNIQANHLINTTKLQNQRPELVNGNIHIPSSINSTDLYHSYSSKDYNSLNKSLNNHNTSNDITKKATSLHNSIMKHMIEATSFQNRSKFPVLGNIYSPQTVTKSWNNLPNNVKFISDGDNGNAGGDVMEVTSGTIIKPITQAATSAVFPPALPFDTNSNNWKLKLDSDVALEVGPSDQLASTFAGNVVTSDNQHIWTHFKDMDLSQAHIVKSKNNDSDSDSDNFANNMGDEPSMSDVFSDTFADDTSLQNLNIDLPNFNGTTNLDGSLQDDINLTNLKLNSHESFEKGGNVTPGPLDDPNLILINSDGDKTTEEVSDGSQPAGWYYVAHDAVIHLVNSDGNTIQDTTSSILMPANVNKYYKADINNQILSKISLPEGYIFVNNPNTYYKMKSYGNSYYVNAEVFNVAPLLKFDYQNEYVDRNNEYNNISNEMALYDEVQRNYENQINGQSALYSPQSLSAQNNSISSENNYDEKAYSNTDSNISGANSLLSVESASGNIIKSLEESSRLLTPIQSSSTNDSNLQIIESNIKSLANNNNQSIQSMNNNASIINSKVIGQRSSITSYYDELRSLSATAYSNYTGYESNVDLVGSYNNQAMSASTSASALNDTMNIISDINSISDTGVTCQSYEMIYGNNINTAKYINIAAMSSANDLAKDNDLAETDFNNIESLYSNSISNDNSESSVVPNSNSIDSNSIDSIGANIRADYEREFSDGTRDFNDLNQDIKVYDAVCADYNNMTVNSDFIPSDLNSLSIQNSSLIDDEHSVEQDYMNNSNAINSLMAQLKSSSTSTNHNLTMTRPKLLLGAMPSNNLTAASSSNNGFTSNVNKLSLLAANTSKIAGKASNASVMSYANELQSMNTAAQKDNTNYSNDISIENSYNAQAGSAKNVASILNNEIKSADLSSMEVLGSKANQAEALMHSYMVDGNNQNSSAMSLTASVATELSQANSIYSNVTSLEPNIKPASMSTSNSNNSSASTSITPTIKPSLSFENSVNDEAGSIAGATNSIANNNRNTSNSTLASSYANDNQSLSLAIRSLASFYTGDEITQSYASATAVSASKAGDRYASQEKSAESQSNNSLAGSLQGDATNEKLVAVNNRVKARSASANMKSLSSEVGSDMSLANTNYQNAKKLIISKSSSASSASSKASKSASGSSSSASKNSKAPATATIQIVFKNPDTGFTKVFSDTNKVDSVIPYKSYMDQLPLFGGKYIMNKYQHDDTYLVPGKTEYVYITSQMDSKGLPPQDQSSASASASTAASLASKSASASASTSASLSASTSASLSTANSLSKSASASASTSTSISEGVSKSASQSTSASISASISKSNDNAKLASNTSQFTSQSVASILNDDASVLNSYNQKNNSYANTILLDLSSLNVSNNPTLSYVKDHISEYASQITSFISRDSNEVDDLYNQSDYANSSSNSSAISTANNDILQASTVASKANLAMTDYIEPLEKQSSKASQTSSASNITSTSSDNSSASNSSLTSSESSSSASSDRTSQSNSIQSSMVSSSSSSSIQSSSNVPISSNMNNSSMTNPVINSRTQNNSTNSIPQNNSEVSPNVIGHNMSNPIASGSSINYEPSTTLENNNIVHSGSNQASNTAISHPTNEASSEPSAEQSSLNDMNNAQSGLNSRVTKTSTKSTNQKAQNNSNNSDKDSDENDNQEPNSDSDQPSDEDVNNPQRMNAKGIHSAQKGASHNSTHRINNNPVNVTNKLSSNYNNSGNKLPRTNETSTKSKELAEISLIMSTTLGELAAFIDKHHDDD